MERCILAVTLLCCGGCGNFTFESSSSSTTDSTGNGPQLGAPIPLPRLDEPQDQEDGDRLPASSGATPVYSDLLTEENHYELTHAFCGSEAIAEYGENGGSGDTSKDTDSNTCYNYGWAHCHSEADKEENTPCREERTIRVHLIFVQCDYESEEEKREACPAGDQCGCLSNSLCVDPCEVGTTWWQLGQTLKSNLCLQIELEARPCDEESKQFADLAYDEDEFERLRDTYRPPSDGIPVYYVRRITREGKISGIQGAAFSPWSKTGIVIARESFGYKHLVHSTGLLAHELGHQLGLLHTFGDSDGTPPQEPCVGETCCAQGDLICDTPPDVEWCQQYCDKLRNARERKGWSIREAAERAGIPIYIVGWLENCAQVTIPPSSDPKALLKKYEDALGIPANERSDDVCEDRCQNEACDPDDHNYLSYRHDLCRYSFSDTQLRVMTCWLRKGQDAFY